VNLTVISRQQLAWIAVCGALFVVTSVIWLDRPVAWLVAHTPRGTRHDASLLRHAINLGLDALLILLPLSLFAIGRAAGWNGTRGGGSSRILLLAGTTTIAAVSINDLVLKPLFGRYTLDDLPQRYGFRLFHGTMDSGFPSGHAALTVAFFWVLLVLCPHRRVLWASIIALTCAGLVLAQWHFLSDVAAGAMVGVFAGMGVIALTTRRDPAQP
jgi:membrane-associated phospholipid phosphatase